MVVLFQVTEDKHLKICVECFACKHVCAPHVYGVHGSQKRVSELLAVEFQVVVGDGNRSWALHKSSSADIEIKLRSTEGIFVETLFSVSSLVTGTGVTLDTLLVFTRDCHCLTASSSVKWR